MMAHDTLRIGQVNTRRIDAGAIAIGMGEKADRLRAARIKAGFDSASEAAEAFGWQSSGYRHHENGTRAYGVEAAQRYARAFKVDVGYLLGIQPGARHTQTPSEGVTITVRGAVAAGVWKEAVEWSSDDQYEVVVPSVPIPNAKRFGLRVVGFSMDQVFPEGTILDCISIYDVNAEPENGDFVIVEQISPDGLHELTVKEFLVDPDGARWLIPRSSRPEFQSICIGRPDTEADIGVRVEVTAFVVGSYAPVNKRFFPKG